MSEGRRVVAGEATLSAVVTVERSPEELLEGMVREHARMVYRIAYAVLRRHHDAEDATQETFMRVLRYNSTLAAVENTKTWLARIAWRVAVDRSKRHARMQEIPLEDPEKPVDVATSNTPADETVSGAQISARLEKLIAALPSKLREPLILSHPRRNVTPRSRGHSRHQRSCSPITRLPGATDPEREADRAN